MVCVDITTESVGEEGKIIMKRTFTKYPSSYVKASIGSGDLELGTAVKTNSGEVMYVTQVLNDDWVWVTPDAKDRYNQNASGYSLPIKWITKVFKR